MAARERKEESKGAEEMTEDKVPEQFVGSRIPPSKRGRSGQRRLLVQSGGQARLPGTIDAEWISIVKELPETTIPADRSKRTCTGTATRQPLRKSPALRPPFLQELHSATASLRAKRTV
jgi:hypothetical protein